MNYGVVNEGFSRKPYAVILAEIEQQLVTEFGPDVIQTAQSPLGQLNGLFADMINELWEYGEDVYQSYDPNQAEGTQLEVLGAIRLLKRDDLETDAKYRLAITNEGKARINTADFLRALKNINGVDYVEVFVNDENKVDENGLEPHSVAVAAIGGDEQEIASVINKYVVPGITSFGNTRIRTEIDGRCRNIGLIRPIEVPITLRVIVRDNPAARDCPSPSPTVIASALLQRFNNVDTRPINGQSITSYLVRSFVESQFAGVEVVRIEARRNNEGDNAPFLDIMTISFWEIALIEEVTVTVVE